MIFHRLGLILNRESRRGVAPSKTPLPPLLRKERGTQGVRLFHKSQRGFTLVELMIALAIVGVVTGGTTMTIFQVIDGGARTSNHMTAVKQVQNAGYWISHDAQMAQIVVTDDVDTVLTLAWVGWEYECGGGDTCISTHEVRYTYDGNNDELWRHETITIVQYDSNGDLVDPQPPQQDSTTLIAEYITPIPTATMDVVSNKLIVTIEATVGDATEERTYEITPRPTT